MVSTSVRREGERLADDCPHRSPSLSRRAVRRGKDDPPRFFIKDGVRALNDPDAARNDSTRGIEGRLDDQCSPDAEGLHYWGVANRRLGDDGELVVAPGGAGGAE